MNADKGMIDFHAHILPGADHGSRNKETTAAQLEIYKRLGVEAVVATPHFYPQRDSVESFLERRNRCTEGISELLSDEMPRVYLGAEVLVCPGIDHMPDLERLCVKGTNTLLLEMPFSSWSEEHIETVRRISRRDLSVVMAHIDRYPMRDVERLFEECSVTFQLNSESFSKLGGKKKLLSLAETLPVTCVGSDLHGEDKGAVKSFLKLAAALEKKGIDVSKRTEELLRGAQPVQY